MSSVQSVFAQPKTNPTVVFTPNTLAYEDSELNTYYPIPFTATNGILDIRVQDNVVNNILTVGSFADLDTQSWQAQVMGGTAPIRSLGPNMILFLNAMIEDEEGSVPSDISIHIAPTMTKLSWNYLTNENCYQFTDEAPTKEDLVWGGPLNNYRTTWVFRSPLVVKYYSNQYSQYKYLTFTSALDSI